MKNTSKWKGDEFIKGEIALSQGAKVKILEWDDDYGGWWYCQALNSGLFGYTRILEKIPKDAATTERHV